MKIIIAGYGFVGTAVNQCLAPYYQLVVVDPKFNKTKITDHPDAGAVIVCVGTPEGVDGRCDISQVQEVLKQVPRNIPVLIKSTLPPDQLRDVVLDSRARVTYSPEFLRAASATQDFLNQTYMILGGEDADFWEAIFKPALPNCEKFIRCTMMEASMIKYATNTFLATKVSFFNHIYDMCQHIGPSYSAVREILSMDERIGSSHMQVPGPDGSRGFGGHCFPKDTEAFVKYAQDIGLSFELLEAAVEHNKKLRKM